MLRNVTKAWKHAQFHGFDCFYISKVRKFNVRLEVSMTSKGLAVDPSMFAGGAYGAHLAAFANAYANTDGFYNSSVFDMYHMDPMMSMYMNPMMNSFYKKAYNPAAHDAMKNGINPMEALFFGNSEKFATVNAQRNAINNGIRQLVDYAMSDNQDDFYTAYNNLLTNECNRLRALMPNMSAEELRAQAKATINTAFMNMNGGNSIQKVLKENADNPFWQGVKDVLGFGLFNDKRTVSNNIAMVEDMDMNGSQRRRERTVQNVGRGTGVLALGGLACGAAWLAKKLIFRK